jgi:hypothetical protein
MRNLLKIPLLLFLTLISGCGHPEENKVKMPLATITDAELEVVKDKKILFAHMSVGGNVIQGIEEIRNDDPRYALLKVVEYSEDSQVKSPGIYHYLVGDNSFPDKKIRSCSEKLIGRKTGGQFDAFVFKFCYVDVKKDTDVNALFSSYSEFVNRVKKQYPDLKLVHVTVPLTVNYRNLKGWLKFRLFRNHPNENRSEFNEKLKEAFGKSDLIYDLASLEASDSSGKELYYMSRGKRVYYLSEELTDDGGHLNAFGRKKAAVELLRTLARLEEKDE